MNLEYYLKVIYVIGTFYLTVHFIVTLARIERKIDTMAKTQQDEADALTATETTVAAIVKDVADEIAKFKAAQSAGEDTTPFVNRINAINAALQGADSAALDAAGTVPVALPPASPAAPATNSTGPVS